LSRYIRRMIQRNPRYGKQHDAKQGNR